MCISGTCAFAIFFAGLAALVSQEKSEIDDFNQRLEHIQFRGFWDRWGWMRRESLPLSQIVAHWRTRLVVRRLIWFGLLSFLIALISGHFASLPK